MFPSASQSISVSEFYLISSGLLILFSMKSHLTINRLALLVAIAFSSLFVNAQDYRWQQRVEYVMNIHLNVNTHRIDGSQKLTYYNNSLDTLTKVYYQLYFNKGITLSSIKKYDEAILCF